MYFWVLFFDNDKVLITQYLQMFNLHLLLIEPIHQVAQANRVKEPGLLPVTSGGEADAHSLDGKTQVKGGASWTDDWLTDILTIQII